MTRYQHPSAIASAVSALEKDLLRDDGPQISTVRNYNFAILPYLPEHELTLRRSIHDLCEKLRDAGWTVGEIPLHRLLLQRIRAMGPDVVESIIATEKRNSAKNKPERALTHLKGMVANALEEATGLAADVIAELDHILDSASPGRPHPERTVIFLGRVGALYPFMRTSALLKHLAGHTRDVPVVLLYPGTCDGQTSLSFMGVMPADRDYRPRIYR